MPSTLSKLSKRLFLPEWAFPYNCYEIGHAWDPSCTASAVDLSLEVTEKALQMYSLLYFVTFLTQRKWSAEGVQRIATSTLRSSAFLGFNCLTMFSLVCFLRKASGKFYFTLFAALPATLGSLMAIFIEQPTRRKALAFYCANIASECIYRVAVRHSLLKPIPRGEVALFTCSVSLLLYICSKHGLKRDPIGLFLKLILGPTEFHRRTSPSHQTGKGNEKSSYNNNKSRNTDLDGEKANKPSGNNLQLSLNPANCNNNSISATTTSKINGSFQSNFLLNQKTGNNSKTDETSECKSLAHLMCNNCKHSTCSHSQSCLVYFLKGFGQSFFALWIGQAALVTGLKVTQIRHDPALIVRALTNRKKLDLCLFASLFTGIYRSVRCGLRWATGSNEAWHSAVAGAVAGPTMLYYPSSIIAINMFWKCIEFAGEYGLATSKDAHSPVDKLVPFLYALSVNIIFVTLVLEPGCLRPSYIQFIDKLTDHKLHQVNRGLLKLFGTDAHVGYEDFFPNLVPEFCTKKFVESVFVWNL